MRHRIVWYIVTKVLDEHNASVFRGDCVRGSRFLQNVGSRMSDYIAPHPKRPKHVGVNKELYSYVY